MKNIIEKFQNRIMLTSEEMAELIERLANGHNLGGSAGKRAAETLSHAHRYLQGEVFMFCLYYIRALSVNAKKGRYDSRNEFACELASKFEKVEKEYYDQRAMHNQELGEKIQNMRSDYLSSKHMIGFYSSVADFIRKNEFEHEFVQRHLRFGVTAENWEDWTHGELGSDDEVIGTFLPEGFVVQYHEDRDRFEVSYQINPEEIFK